MSKNIIIQEGGIGKQLTVDKLKTGLVGGGACLWVPEDEVQLTTKTVTGNGTYKASDDGYYGYEQVIVNVAGVGIATGTDDDGDEAVARTDPNTGKLVQNKVPSRIEVVTPPTNPYGTYTDGQTIGTEGMVVKAYLASGNEYGTVPINEITINPTTAVYDARTDTGGGQSSTIDDPYYDMYNPPVSAYVSITCSANNKREGDGNINFEKHTAGSLALCVPFSPTLDTEAWVWVSLTNDTLESTTTKYFEDGTITTTIDTKTLVNSSTTKISNTTFYYLLESFGDLGWAWQNISVAPNRFENFDIRDIATILFDGISTPIQAGSHQQITVSWPRPGDGKVLETTFEIIVAPPNGSGEN